MKVFDLNGREHHWKTSGCLKKPNNKSKLHLHARDILENIYPNLIILEEVPIKIYADKTLFLDFYIPLYKKAIEVHGQQHFEFNSMFHTSKFEFKRQQLNDMLKEEWCVKNNIQHIILPWDRKNEWKVLLTT